jgi:hypothetical protein
MNEEEFARLAAYFNDNGELIESQETDTPQQRARELSDAARGGRPAVNQDTPTAGPRPVAEMKLQQRMRKLLEKAL